MGLSKRQVEATLIALLALVFGSPSGRADLLVGNCTIAQDPLADENRVAPETCVKASGGTEAAYVSGRPLNNNWLYYGSGYVGLFPASWVSFQTRATYKHLVPFKEGGNTDLDRRVDYAVLQLGNPVLHKYRLTAGRTRLPFGVDHSDAPITYQWHTNRKFWESPEKSGYVTFDDLLAARFDLGIGAGDSKDAKDNSERRQDRAVSARFAYDVSALEGTRMVASGYVGRNGERRWGFALVNVNRKSDYTAIELVRRLTTPDGSQDPFEQIFRIAYTGAWQGRRRWIFQFDDERLRFRRGVLAHEIKMVESPSWVARIAVGYDKSESGQDLRLWSLTTGLEAGL